MWQWLNKLMLGHWTADRIENALAEGTPDVTYSVRASCERCATGWIELKYVAREPKSIDHVLRIPHFTADQRNFLIRHGRFAESAWLMVGVESRFYLFGWEAVDKVGKVSFRDFQDLAAHSGVITLEDRLGQAAALARVLVWAS